MLISSKIFEKQPNKKTKPNSDDTQEKETNFTNDVENKKIKSQNLRIEINKPLKYQSNEEEMKMSITPDAEELHAERRL
jgi:hypothetical protein